MSAAREKEQPESKSANSNPANRNFEVGTSKALSIPDHCPLDNRCAAPGAEAIRFLNRPAAFWAEPGGFLAALTPPAGNQDLQVVIRRLPYGSRGGAIWSRLQAARRDGSFKAYFSALARALGLV
jgi:hypothetical protein